MNLTIDIGNTSAKAAIFDGERLLCSQRIDEDFERQLQDIIAQYAPQRCAISNVAGEREEVRAALNALPMDRVHLSWQTPVEVFGLSRIPMGLGADRLAAILGATYLCPHRPLLVVDAGTCLTYDYLSAEGVYLGGSISPGLSLRLQAMHEHTALLPLVPLHGDAPLVGHDTATALRSGVVHGARFEIEGFFAADRRQRGDVTLFFAGADPLPFSEEVKKHLVAEPLLVAIGLNRLLHSGCATP